VQSICIDKNIFKESVNTPTFAANLLKILLKIDKIIIFSLDLHLFL